MISTTKHPDGYYQVNHGGRSIGRAASPGDAGMKIKNYVKNLQPGDTGMHNVDSMALKDEDGVGKSDYGKFKGGSQYDATANLKRKANNVGDVAGEGKNTNVKAFSTKPGQLSAKQQAAKTPYKGAAGPVKKWTPEQIAAENEARKLKKNADGPWVTHASVPNADEEVKNLQKTNPVNKAEDIMSTQLANMMAGRAMLGIKPPAQPTDQEMFGHLIPTEEQIEKAEQGWNNRLNWLEEAIKPISSRFNSPEEEAQYWASIKVADRDDGKSGY
jgi:hypothetical protein